jgi:uncharacterized repeat protein (TIGR02543 family)
VSTKGVVVLLSLKTRKLFCIIAIFIILSSLSFFVPEAKANPPISKIMPLGDSITVGYPGYPDLDGYRKSLSLDLSNFGLGVDFVGSQKNGTFLDNDNEGHLGYEANQIRDNVMGWLNNNPASIVLLHIGTNDIENGQGASAIVAEVASTLDNIDQWESIHGQVTVVLARIILRGDNPSWNTTTKSYDDALQTMALSRIANGDRIVVVDMENALNYSTDMNPDGIHPNPSGYGKMEGVWYSALLKIIGYSLTVNYVGQGVVTRLPDSVAYPFGAIVNLTAQSAGGWTFSSWSGDLTGSTVSQNITMDTNKVVTATFNPMYKLTISANYGTTTPSAGEHWYVAGTNVTIVSSPPTAGPNERFSWLNWTGTGSSSYSGTNNTIVITMNSSVTETAFLTHEYKVTISSNFGTTMPSLGQNWYEAGSPVTITASITNSTDTRASWTGWTGSGINSYTGLSNPIVLTINGPVTENALWNIEYKLSISTNLGTTQPPAGDTWFTAGALVNVETSPPTQQTGVQYVCLGWTGTGSVPPTGNNSNLAFTIISPSSISWMWKTQYYLTVSSVYGTTAGSGWYDSGTSAYAAVSPTTSVGTGNTQYVFSGWGGDASGSSSPSNPLVMTGPKTATANWQIQNLQTPTSTPTPTVSPSPTPTVLPSATPTVSPSSTFAPSSTPTQSPTENSGSMNTYLLYGGITSIILVGTIIGIIVFRRFKCSQSPEVIESRLN